MAELEPVSYRSGDTDLAGFIADGSRGRKTAGILLAHEGGGLDDHIKSCALALAELGYVAFACDLFGETDDPPYSRFRAIVQELRADRSLLRARMNAGLDVLLAHRSVDPQRIAAVGFCFGGAAVIELARTGAALKAVAGMHAGVLPAQNPDGNRAIGAALLLCHGAADPVVPLDQILALTTELNATDVAWQLHVYGNVGHSFTNPAIDAFGIPGFAYDEQADRRSWQAMLELFEETLSP